MVTEIYADTLFAINFSMDFLALFLTGKFCHAEISGKRLTLSALLGALFSIAVIFLPDDLIIFRLLGLIGTFLCALFMIVIGFGEKKRRLFRFVFVFGAVNIALGGLMTVLYTFLGKMIPSSSENGNQEEPFPFFLLAALISALITLLYDRLRRPSMPKKCRVSVEVFGNCKEWPAFCDSGNLLTDPISGRPVIILTPSAAKELLPEVFSVSLDAPDRINDLPAQMAKRLRLIPSSGVCGEKLLSGFLPDRVIVKTDRETFAVEAVIAIGECLKSVADFDVILPERLYST